MDIEAREFYNLEEEVNILKSALHSCRLDIQDVTNIVAKMLSDGFKIEAMKADGDVYTITFTVSDLLRYLPPNNGYVGSIYELVGLHIAHRLQEGFSKKDQAKRKKRDEAQIQA